MNRYLSIMAAAVASAAMFGCSHSGSSYSSTDDMSRPTSPSANNNTAMDSQAKTNGDTSAAYSNGADKQPYANSGTSKYNDGSSMGGTGMTAGTMNSTGTYSSGSSNGSMSNGSMGGMSHGSMSSTNQPLHSGDTGTNSTSGSLSSTDAASAGATGMTARQTGSPSQGATGDTNQGQTRTNNSQDQTVQAMNGQGTQGGNTAGVANANLSDQDKTFVQTAASSGMYEVQSSKLAQQNAQNADLKNMAQHMIDDHTKVNTQLMDLASKDGLTPSTSLATKDQQNLDALQKANGADFDKLYAQQQIQAHQDSISLFQQEADSGQNADLKSFASQNLPTLKDHLKMLQDSSSKMANDR